MGSAITSPSTTPVAFVGRPHGPPRCKSAPLYHRAQVARPISQGLQGGETPFCARLRPVVLGCARLCPAAPACARLRPVVPSSAVPHHPAPSRTVPHRHTRPLSRRSPVAPQSLRTPAPSHPGPFALQSLRAPAPSHPGPFASLLQSLPLLFPTASPSKAHSHTALQSSRKSLEIDHRPISPNQMLLFFRVVRV